VDLRVEELKYKVKRQVAQQKGRMSLACIDLVAEQGTDAAELYLEYLGQWANLLGVKEVRVHIRTT
jgi:hypothetical protein